MTIMSAKLEVQYSAPPLIQPCALECLLLSNITFDILRVFLSLLNYTLLHQLRKFHELVKLQKCKNYFHSSK